MLLSLLLVNHMTVTYGIVLNAKLDAQVVVKLVHKDRARLEMSFTKNVRNVAKSSKTGYILHLVLLNYWN